MQKWKVMGLGEALWDCFGDQRRPGGAPANVAFQCNQLGAEGIIASRVGKDALGDELVRIFAGLDMRTDGIQVDPELPTGTVAVQLDTHGVATYTIHTGTAWDALRFTPELATLAGGLDAVCFGSLAQRSETARATIRSVLEAVPPGCLRVFDVNLRQRYYSADILRESMRLSDVVKLNEEEAHTVAGALEFPETLERGGLAGFCRHLGEAYALQKVCVTRGADGCVLVDCRCGEVVEVPGISVPVADTVGSGDAFTAALICASLAGFSLHAQARFANQVGTLVATRHGAMPDLREELTCLWRNA